MSRAINTLTLWTGLCVCVFSTLLINLFLTYLVHSSHHTPSSFATRILNVCYCLQWGGCVCVFVSGEQMDSAISLCCITCRSVTWACHGAWEPKKSHDTPPPSKSPPPQDLPLVWVTGICLIYMYSLQQLGAPFPLRTFGNREGAPAANLTQAGPQGRSRSVVATSAASACCLTAWDNRRCGMGVWYGLW